jgi:hypothetical protein
VLTSAELASVLGRIFRFPKAAAIGIAGLPDDADDRSIRGAYRLIEGAIEGVKGR